MSYHLGVDLGTTYTAAAVWEEGRVDIANLGNRAPVIPSVLLLREDEELLTGEAANRRASAEPSRVAREFKRRLGDPAPLIVGGTPWSAAALMGRLLRWVVDKVSEAQGGPPASIAVSHPANWGQYKVDLLDQAIQVADLDDVVTLTEPEAAAIHYGSLTRVAPGALVAVYDLGGGTFDAAVLRKTDDGFEILGEPQGVERLGGVDFDEAVFQHVNRELDGAIDALDPDDPAVWAAVARLRTECTDAKEALSDDADVTIPVILPELQTDVRLTRAEFEHLIRPALTDSITSLQRALRSAGVEPEELSAVLLVGGSSRIPLVGQLVSSAVGRPIAVDAHPKHSVALGAAMASALAAGEELRVFFSPATGSVEATAPAPDTEVVDTVAPDGPTETEPSTEPVAAASPVAPSAPPTEPVAATTPPVAAADPTEPVAATTPPVAAADPTEPVAAPPEPERPMPEPAPKPPAPEDKSKLPIPLLIGGGVIVLLLIVVAVLALGGGDDNPSDVASTDTTEATEATDDPGTTQSTQSTTPTTAAPTGPFVTIDHAGVESDRFRLNYSVANFEPLIGGGPDSLHLHFFLDTTEPANAGNNGNPPGVWEITDDPSTFLMQIGPDDATGASQICGVVATVDHNVLDPESGTCVDLP